MIIVNGRILLTVLVLMLVMVWLFGVQEHGTAN